MFYLYSIKYYKGQNSEKQLATNKAICHKAKNKSLKVHITLIIFVLVLRHITLLVASLVVASYWSLAWAWIKYW
jgi:Ca2+/Na+ antiporter